MPPISLLRGLITTRRYILIHLSVQQGYKCDTRQVMSAASFLSVITPQLYGKFTNILSFLLKLLGNIIFWRYYNIVFQETSFWSAAPYLLMCCLITRLHVWNLQFTPWILCHFLHQDWQFRIYFYFTYLSKVLVPRKWGKKIQNKVFVY